VSRDILLILEDIENACQRIIRYTRDLDRDTAFGEDLRFDAVLHNVLVIGEAVKKLPRDFRDRHADLPWREIAGMRDFVAHAYFALDLEILWDVVQTNVPALLVRIHAIAEDESRQR
jgi:uncharacterized protein with HEPN domain